MAPITNVRKPTSKLDPLQILAQQATPASPFQVKRHVDQAARNWDIFYKNHGAGFFLERHWTVNEFAALASLGDEEEGVGQDRKGKGRDPIVLEVGCGTGAFVYPLLETFPGVRFHCFDFSARAVDLVKKHEKYGSSRVNTFVHDLTTGSLSLLEKLENAPPEFWSYPAASGSSESAPSTSTKPLPSVISCIFVLSALPPSKQQGAIQSLFDVLALGGSLILRDYALHDQAQLRLHALPSNGYSTVPSLLSAPLPASDPSSPDSSSREDLVNFGKPWYKRGDGTMTYFFRVDEIEGLMRNCRDSEGKFKLEGSSEVVEREMENRGEGWGCTRRFVQGSFKKVLIVQE